MLTLHPEICNGTRKEMHFFDDNWGKGFVWYTEQYARAQGCVGNKYLLDATPRYVRVNWIPDLIQEAYRPSELTKKKFLLILREPVSREFSWYNHMLRSCLSGISKFVKSNPPKLIFMKETNITMLGYAKEDLCVHLCTELGCTDLPADAAYAANSHLRTFDEYAITKREVVHHGSSCAKQIHNWLRVIKREQLFVVSSETFFTQPADTLHRIAQFLHLSTDWGQEVTLPHSNEGGDVGAFITCRMHDELQAYFDPLNTELFNLLNHAPGKPASEPHFPPFTSSRRICREDGTAGKRRRV